MCFPSMRCLPLLKHFISFTFQWTSTMLLLLSPSSSSSAAWLLLLMLENLFAVANQQWIRPISCEQCSDISRSCSFPIFGTARRYLEEEKRRAGAREGKEKEMMLRRCCRLSGRSRDGPLDKWQCSARWLEGHGRRWPPAHLYPSLH